MMKPEIFMPCFDALAACTVGLVFAVAAVHFWAQRTTSRFMILAGLALFAISSVMQMVYPRFEVGRPTDGSSLPPNQWYVVCESVVVAAHACLLAGLLGEAFAIVGKRLDGWFARLTRPTQGESESL